MKTGTTNALSRRLEDRGFAERPCLIGANLGRCSRSRLSALQDSVMKHKTTKMHSGGVALILDPKSTWSKFPKRSRFWASKLGAEIIGEPVITVDECILEVKIDGGFFWITYDDFQSSVQLEPKEPEFNEIVLNIQSKLNSST